MPKNEQLNTGTETLSALELKANLNPEQRAYLEVLKDKMKKVLGNKTKQELAKAGDLMTLKNYRAVLLEIFEFLKTKEMPVKYGEFRIFQKQVLVLEQIEDLIMALPVPADKGGFITREEARKAIIDKELKVENSNVTDLSVSDFGFTALPDLDDLVGLKILSCGGNQLATLPKLPAGIEEINAASNKISKLTALPASLKKILLNQNELTSLPPLPDNLEELLVSSNSLHNIDALPSNLKELNCNFNKLIKLPDLVPGLQKLNCGGNQLTVLPDLPDSLITLECFKNNLISLPKLPDHLENLGCYENKLTKLPKLPDSVRYLNCQNNELTSLPNYPRSLAILYLGNNLISDAEKDRMQKASFLKFRIIW